MRGYLFAALALFWSALALADVAIPPVARVTDLTGTLSGEQRNALDQKLAAFEQRKGSQVAVLLLPSTQPETIEQYGIRVADAWKLGRKGVDDGAILLAALEDRALRIEVGYGLEGAVPDAIAKRIIDETVLPHFRGNDIYGGIDAGLNQLLAVIDGEALPPPAAASASDDLMARAMPFLFIVLVVGQMLRAMLGAGLAAALVGGGAFLLAWLVVGLGPGIVFGLIAFVLTLTGMAGGGFGGSHRGGGGFGGGGGFRGGGGGFGGGGASGRW